MGNQKISNDLKDAALRMEDRGYTTEEILDIAGFSKSTLSRTRRTKRLTGSVAKAPAIGRGRPRVVQMMDIKYLINLARHNPTLFLDEYARRISDAQLLDISLSTIHRSFSRVGINVKHVQKLASERDPIIRADYVGHNMTKFTKWAYYGSICELSDLMQCYSPVLITHSTALAAQLSYA
ncbi:hypothetical protein FIBSPDRAFT_723430 [Athelia psychrophila]|uniref:Transposase Tc1-like domain-containing protein n=1 Tax=Athelia psychrophila TaxID=1759441 RepID=A0A166UVT8_9AGAM|nr:hypothetical protein FIBSPDRAFT_723430 [Fibularhizoctonia sp. CBS 109695]